MLITFESLSNGILPESFQDHSICSCPIKGSPDNLGLPFYSPLESHFQADCHCAELRAIAAAKNIEGVVFVVDADVVNDDFGSHSNREAALMNVSRRYLLLFAILIVTRLE